MSVVPSAPSVSVEVDGTPIIIAPSSISLSVSAPGIKSLKTRLDPPPKHRLQLCPEMQGIRGMLNFDQLHDVSRKVLA